MTLPVSGGVPPFVKLALTLERKPGSTDDMVCRELGAILQDALDSAHHIEGFRTEALERPRPALPKSTLCFHSFPCPSCGVEMGQVLRGVYTFTAPHPLRLTDAEFARRREDMLAGRSPGAIKVGGGGNMVDSDGRDWDATSFGAALPPQTGTAQEAPRCDHCKGAMELIWVCDRKHPVVYRLARQAGIELGAPQTGNPPPEAEVLFVARRIYTHAAQTGLLGPVSRYAYSLLSDTERAEWDSVARAALDELDAVRRGNL